MSPGLVIEKISEFQILWKKNKIKYKTLSVRPSGKADTGFGNHYWTVKFSGHKQDRKVRVL